mmetsp:Transcript_3859/g.10557  ORF Transcript_3859/g.10557 Transcript_3859/m.10557 type:complete len:208 (+) Transcript_3859:362-985(+)
MRPRAALWRSTARLEGQGDPGPPRSRLCHGRAPAGMDRGAPHVSRHQERIRLGKAASQNRVHSGLSKPIAVPEMAPLLVRRRDFVAQSGHSRVLAIVSGRLGQCHATTIVEGVSMRRDDGGGGQPQPRWLTDDGKKKTMIRAISSPYRLPTMIYNPALRDVRQSSSRVPRLPSVAMWGSRNVASSNKTLAIPFFWPNRFSGERPPHQ